MYFNFEESFWDKAITCKTDTDKIQFFDENKVAFFLHNSLEEIDDMFYIYANMKRLTEKDLDSLIKKEWVELPDALKLFAFQFCILDGEAYKQIRSTTPIL